MFNFGYLCAFAAIFFWSFNLIISSYFASRLSPWEIAFGRWFVGALILICFTWAELKHHRALLWRHKYLIFWLAMSGIVLNNTMIYYAGETISAVNMGLLDITGPIFLVLLSAFILHTPVAREQIFGIVAAILGVMIIITQGDLTQLAKIKFADGDFWMLLNTFCFAIYSLLQSRRPQEISQSLMLSATAICGVFIMLPIVYFMVPEKQLLSLRPTDIGVMIYLGIFNSVLAYLAWNTALNKIGNVKTSIIYYLLPIFSGAEAYYFLGEQIHKSQVYGGLMVISGIVLVGLKKRKKSPEVK